MAAAAVQQKSKTYTGQGIRPPKVGKHFLHIDDFSKEELWQMLQTSLKVAEHLAFTSSCCQHTGLTDSLRSPPFHEPPGASLNYV